MILNSVYDWLVSYALLYNNCKAIIALLTILFLCEIIMISKFWTQT